MHACKRAYGGGPGVNIAVLDFFLPSDTICTDLREVRVMVELQMHNSMDQILFNLHRSPG